MNSSCAVQINVLLGYAVIFVFNLLLYKYRCHLINIFVYMNSIMKSSANKTRSFTESGHKSGSSWLLTISTGSSGRTVLIKVFAGGAKFARFTAISIHITRIALTLARVGPVRTIVVGVHTVGIGYGNRLGQSTELTRLSAFIK